MARNDAAKVAKTRRNSVSSSAAISRGWSMLARRSDSCAPSSSRSRCRTARPPEIERRQCEGQELRQELGIEPLYQERERAKVRFWGLRARLLDTPAATVDGVVAKMRGFYNDGEVADMRAGSDPDDALAEEFAASVYRDLERLAGEARS